MRVETADLTIYVVCIASHELNGLDLDSALALVNIDLIVSRREVLGALGSLIGREVEFIASGRENIEEIVNSLLSGRREQEMGDLAIVWSKIGDGTSANGEDLLARALRRLRESGHEVASLPLIGDRELDPEIPLPLSGPLVGKDVVVTRAVHQAGALARRLLLAGARPVLLPAISIEVNDAMRAVLDRAVYGAPPEWIVFSSQNAVYAFGENPRSASFVREAKVACVGPATAAAAERAGMQVSFVPSASSAEALARELPAPTVPGSDRALFFAGDRAGTTVEHLLTARGYVVERLDIYRTKAALNGKGAIRRAISADAIVFSSPSAARETVRRLGRARVPREIVTIGPTTAAEVLASGLEVAAEAGAADPEAIVQSLAGCLR